MAETTQTLQQKIEERAKKKLDQALSQFAESIRSNSFSRIPNHVSKEKEKLIQLQLGVAEEGGNNEPRDLATLVFYSGYAGRRSTYLDRLYDVWLPIFIEQETEDFVKKVDELVDFKNNHEE